MAKRRTKKRTQVQGKDDSVNTKNGASATSQTPKSMVIRIGAGEVGSSVSQLVKDFRLMMEPDTASRLRVRLPSLGEKRERESSN
jgi:ribosome biogenesis protein SSF1/2